MGKRINQILHPEREGLKGKDKPIVLIVHSPHDEAGASVDFGATSSMLGELGYGTISKCRLLYSSELDESVLTRAIRPVKMGGKSITLWMESHGAPGWLFGGTRDARDEFQWAVYFARFIRGIERHTEGVVENIVLSGCFTANEFMSEDTLTYLNCPARMLSILLPEKKVMGFVGQNASAKVTNVYHKAADGSFKPVVLNPEDAAILFKGGEVLESYHGSRKPPVYCTYMYTPAFILEVCNPGVSMADRKKVYYEPILAKEMIAAKRMYVDPKGYGAAQVKVATHVAGKLALEDAAAPRVAASHGGAAGGAGSEDTESDGDVVSVGSPSPGRA